MDLIDLISKCFLESKDNVFFKVDCEPQPDGNFSIHMLSLPKVSNTMGNCLFSRTSVSPEDVESLKSHLYQLRDDKRIEQWGVCFEYNPSNRNNFYFKFQKC